MIFRNKSSVDEKTILEALRKVNDPELNRSIVDLGMVGKIEGNDGDVRIQIKLTVPGCPLKQKIDGDIKAVLGAIPEIKNVNIEFSVMSSEERMALTGKMTGQSKSPIFDNVKVKNVIAVASGKGGVGKSTITVNLACALKNAGCTVGIVDADVYGFSIPRMMGVNALPTVIDETIIPVIKNGIKIISMGFFVEEDQAVLWRGPMLHKAIVQFLTQVFWDRLDFLLIDLPPGTGDVTLSIAQTIKESHLLIVTTPQPAAAGVAQRVAELSRKANFRILGVVENMSYFVTADGAKQMIFGEGGGQELAQKLNQPLLARIPLETAIREGGDMGIPVTESTKGEGPAIFKFLAEKIIRTLKV